MRNRLARKMAAEMREATCAGTQTSKAPTLSGPSVTNHYSVAMFLASALNRGIHPPEILQNATNTGGKCFSLGHWLRTWRPWRMLTNHRRITDESPDTFLTEHFPLYSIYSLTWRPWRMLTNHRRIAWRFFDWTFLSL